MMDWRWGKVILGSSTGCLVVVVVVVVVCVCLCGNASKVADRCREKKNELLHAEEQKIKQQ